MAISGIEIDKGKIIEALYAKKGVIEQAAKSLGCQPSTIYRHIDREPEVKEALEDARKIREQERIEYQECLKDAAYQSASKLLSRNDTTMTIFIMKTLGGLTEKPSYGVKEVIYRGSNDDRPNETLSA